MWWKAIGFDLSQTWEHWDNITPPHSLNTGYIWSFLDDHKQETLPTTNKKKEIACFFSIPHESPSLLTPVFSYFFISCLSVSFYFKCQSMSVSILVFRSFFLFCISLINTLLHQGSSWGTAQVWSRSNSVTFRGRQRLYKDTCFKWNCTMNG